MLTDKYKPVSLMDIVGQEKAVKTLRKFAQIADRGALLLEGPSGSGKTSAAHAIAHELGVDTGAGSMDFQKIEAAECNVNTIRELAAKLPIAAWGETGWKVTLIDEAHTMSLQARNRLLSVLENLPAKRLVIFTTTEFASLEKTDPIMLSRLIRVHFGKPAFVPLVKHIERVIAETDPDAIGQLPVETLIRDAKSNVRACLMNVEQRLMAL